MFQMKDRRTGRTRIIYGVHKSGPRDEQTKFLIFSNGWKWVWANNFAPRPQKAGIAGLIVEPVDLLAGEKAERVPALASLG